jgi:hypothetical protein
VHDLRRTNDKESIMKMAVVAGTIPLLALMSSSPGSPQTGPGPGRGSGGWRAATAYGRLYDPGTVETTQGKVVSVQRLFPRPGMSAGMHLLVDTGKERLSVHLGPEWYIERQDVPLEPGDAIEVKGSRISFEGKPALVAAEVRKGAEVLRLRDDAGFPVWSGWRRR